MTEEVKEVQLSLVVPIYNEIGNLNALRERCESMFAQLLPELHWELILVNDGSQDGSLEKMLQIHDENPKIKVLNLSRNFGHQIAITAGMEFSSGEAIAVMDGDLQDPPEVIAEMWRVYKEEGVDVVYGQRRKRDGESYFKLATASFFYRLLKKISKVEIPVDAGDFRLMSRRSVKSFLSCRESHRFVRGLTSWVGYRQKAVFYDREERFSGETKYPLVKMLKFAWDGITSFSNVPLKCATYLGVATLMFSFLYALFVCYCYIFQPEVLVKGWSSTILIILMLGGGQLLMLGVMGEYIGRINDEIKQRPLYLVDRFHDDD